MMYPLVRELAVDGIPVTVTCRVLKLARQPYYRWLTAPVGRRELASAYPGPGGDYRYLVRAYGGRVGFLYGWARLAIIQTGSVALLAYVFGDYMASVLWTQILGTMHLARIGVVVHQSAPDVPTLLRVDPDEIRRTSVRVALAAIAAG